MVSKDEILRFVDNPKKEISTFEVINWPKTHPHVSVHALIQDIRS